MSVLYRGQQLEPTGLPVTASTFKAEISHLCRALGGDIATGRYALSTPCPATPPRCCVHCVTVMRTLLRRYGGPLLSRSDTPWTGAWRTHLDVAVREAVLASSQVAWGERRCSGRLSTEEA
ncbi:hypothetical protein [Streptomyces sp. NPDC018693]|uniref:hypothetical protein n=1 Tax=unclassified Streptomyces TaxID=2593676 RepID=UPI00379E93DA